MQIQIISREIVKPASSETHHDDLNSFQLSVMDKLFPRIYTPITFFYSMKETNAHFEKKEEATSRLISSLSEALARFYVLARRIYGNFVHCSGEGALFVEAKVKGTMAEFLKQPKLELLSQFFPFPLAVSEPFDKAVQIGAQVNVFSCGGIAISLSFLHVIIDGITMSSFIKSWAASCRETIEEKLVCGDYTRVSSLFPHREISPGYALMSPETPFAVPKGGCSVTRRFVFDVMAISDLKAKAKSNEVPNPTSIEAITCFIWKYAMKASRSDEKKLLATSQEPNWSSVLVHTVNMRKRLQPSLPEHSIGNIYWRSRSYYEASNTEIKLHDLEKILRESLSEINNEYIQKMIGEEGFETILSSLQQLHELYEKASESYIFTSWRNMGFNEINFGWGKPTWIATGGSIYDSMVRNAIILMDTVNGEGMEVWVILDEETMNILEHDHEFLKFASLNPSISLD